MLRIDQLRLLPDESEDVLLHKCARLLRVVPSALTGLTVLRRAIDARESLTFVYTVAVSAPQEAALLRRCRDKRVTAYTPEQYALPAPVAPPEVRPIVVGAGPAGLFAALVLAKCGARPILLERGQCVEQRQRDVQRFWATGQLDTESNVQFGEGGAGAFSDGKLNTGTRDLRHRFIMEELVSCGAPESILADALPHVGTDKLHIALQALRRQLLALGADIRFGARLEGLTVQEDALTAVTVRQGEQLYTLPARQVVLALGHSARDTFEMLYGAGLAMEQKPFAMGVRIEHRQSAEDAAFALGGGDYRAPCQRVEDFLAHRPSTGPGNVQPSYLPAVTYTDLHRCLPPFVCETLAQALPVLGRKLKGYDSPDALLTGVETRSSSPVRLVRDEYYEANIRGIYPCGEGACYAGGILSAAADGMRCAEKLLEVYR